MHSLFWIAKYAYRVDGIMDVLAQGVLRDAEARRFALAQRFLWTVRCHLHFHAGRAAELGQTDDQYRERFGADTLLKRPGTPDEVAAAICFLASDDASFITGTCLFVDGGLTAFAEG